MGCVTFARGGEPVGQLCPAGRSAPPEIHGAEGELWRAIFAAACAAAGAAVTRAEGRAAGRRARCLERAV